jgi:hypothetical protein
MKDINICSLYPYNPNILNNVIEKICSKVLTIIALTKKTYTHGLKFAHFIFFWCSHKNIFNFFSKSKKYFCHMTYVVYTNWKKKSTSNFIVYKRSDQFYTIQKKWLLSESPVKLKKYPLSWLVLMCVSQVFITVPKCLREFNIKEERFTLVYAFRGFSP